jgi:putative ABC transport system permease protein
MIWKNLTREKVRALFTLLSVVVAFTLYGMLASLSGLFSGEARYSEQNRIFILPKFATPLPLAHLEKIRAVEGVNSDYLTYLYNMLGYYQDPQNTFQQNAVDVDTFINNQSVTERFVWNQAELEAWRNNRTGVLIQQRVADEFRLKKGDTLPLVAPDVQKIDGTNFWEFEVMGIYDYSNPDEDPLQLFFHYDYFNESRVNNRDMVNAYVAIVDDPQQVDRIANEIDALFMNSGYETSSGTEDSLTRDYFRRLGNISFGINLILGAVFLTMLLVTGNSMAQGFRERVHEIGILKTIGFTGNWVLFLIVVEAALMLLMGGVLGLGIAWVIVEYGKTIIDDALYLSTGNVVLGFVIMLLMGLVVGGIPALRARRLTITDALGRG